MKVIPPKPEVSADLIRHTLGDNMNREVKIIIILLMILVIVVAGGISLSFQGFNPEPGETVALRLDQPNLAMLNLLGWEIDSQAVASSDPLPADCRLHRNVYIPDALFALCLETQSAPPIVPGMAKSISAGFCKPGGVCRQIERHSGGE